MVGIIQEADGSFSLINDKTSVKVLTTHNSGAATAAMIGDPGTVGSPTSGTLALSTHRSGNIFSSVFTLTACRVPVTDGAASGSYGTLKLLDFPDGYIHILSASGVYTAFAEGSALTTAAGDAAFVLGLGTTAIAAAQDGTFGTASNHDILAKTSTITLSGGTGTGKHITLSALGFDGTATALDLNLNFSGTAATIDANSNIDVTGIIRVNWVFMGDA